MGFRELWDESMEKTTLRVWPSPLTRADKNAITLNLPGYRQVCFYTCGFVAGLMVARAHDPELSIEKFYQLVNPTEDGTSDEQIMEALEKVGVKAKRRLDLSFTNIGKSIMANHPIITSVDRGHLGLHWVVIYGFGWDPLRIFVAGNEVPGLGCLLRSHEMTWSDFKDVWDPYGDGLVCSW